MVQLEGMNVEGGMIENLDPKDRWFEICGEPTYKEVPSLDNPEEKIRKLIIPVKLGNGDCMDYYPNSTSRKKMAILAGTTDLSKWKGKKFIWGKIAEMQVRGEFRKVLFVTDLKNGKK